MEFIRSVSKYGHATAQSIYFFQQNRDYTLPIQKHHLFYASAEYLTLSKNTKASEFMYHDLCIELFGIPRFFKSQSRVLMYLHTLRIIIRGNRTDIEI